MADAPLKIVVLDDDPTGSQTVHSCPLLLRWDAGTLRAALAHPAPLLFLLANTRALDPEAARQRVRQLCRCLRPLLEEAVAAGRIGAWLIVSRGDSTLRSHFPLEVEVIAAELGPFDATVLAPAFLPGGRTTVDGVHLLHGEPVHRTAFARDGLFGYGTSDLSAWVEEKSAGRIRADQVERIGWRELEAAAGAEAAAGSADEGHAEDGAGHGGDQALLRKLAAFQGNPVVVVDAERPQHLLALGAALRQLTAPAAAERWGRPRRFLFQSAASLLNGLAELPPPPLDAGGLAALRRCDRAGTPLPGLVLVGSHVPLADAQLERLLADPACAGVEVEVRRLARVLEGPLPAPLLASLEQDWRQALRRILTSGRTPVLFSSRGELLCRSATERRAFGLALAALMARLAASLAPDLGYLISKGGITTHTLLADGLDLAAVDLRGQLLPGLSLVQPAGACGPLAGLPLLTFPGNLGDADTLHLSWLWMEGRAAPAHGALGNRWMDPGAPRRRG